MFRTNLKTKEEPIRDYLSADDLVERLGCRRFKNKGLKVVDERINNRGEKILKLETTTFFSDVIETSKKLNQNLGIRYEKNRGFNGKNSK